MNRAFFALGVRCFVDERVHVWRVGPIGLAGHLVYQFLSNDVISSGFGWNCL